MSLASQHPDEQQLKRWLSGESPPQEETWVEDHLEQCDQCALKLDDLQQPVDAFEARIKELAKSGDSGATELSYSKGGVGDGASDRRDLSGTIIGPYELIDVVGEGGMGTVWRASQKEPIKRIVAVKIIKAGMDTREVIARFESERQALAIMDHPHIARVFDAGETQTGRPYFVMEFVEGVPITNYCDEHKASTEQRLELFCQVCEAIQHAHRKGVIHRDIKPSNILVSLDGKVPEIKVIDFGLAKATNQRLTEKTLFTQIGQLVGTPAYMSPEQADSTGTDIDTRTDVYSLGVLLYELLTGATPFDSTELLDKGYAEIQRVIRDVDPPTPSTQLSSADQDSATIAVQRATDPKHLVQFVRGDLDVIVMKSLEKDRSRRYDSPTEFANDVQRFLKHEPIEARPPSAAYRLRRLYERNRVAFVATSIVLATILIGSITSAIMAIKATAAANLAEQRLEDVQSEKEKVNSALADSEAARIKAEQVSQLMIGIFESPDPSNDGNSITVAEMLDRAADRVTTELNDQPGRQAELKLVISKTYEALSLYKKAIPLAEEVVEYRLANKESTEDDTHVAQIHLGDCYVRGHRYDDAVPIISSLVEELMRVRGPDDKTTLVAKNTLANAMWRGGNAKDARISVLEIREDIVARAERTLGPSNSTTLVFKNNLANSYAQLQRFDEALKLRQEVLAQYREQFGSDSPRTLISLQTIVSGLRKNDKALAALPFAKEAAERGRSTLGDEHAWTLRSMQVYALLLWKTGDLQESTNVFEQLLGIHRKIEGSGSEKVQKMTFDLIRKFGLSQQHEKALLLGQEFVAYAKRTIGTDSPKVQDAIQETAQSIGWCPGANESQLKQASDMLIELRESKPTFRNLRLLGVIQYRQRDYTTALASLEKVNRKMPYAPESRYFTAMLHMQMNDHEAAREQLAIAEEMFSKRKSNDAWTVAAQSEAKQLISE